MNQKSIQYPGTELLRGQLISHNASTENNSENLLQAIEMRLRAVGDLAVATVEQQLWLLAELASFDLGMFLIKNRGLNAYWTHRIVTWCAEQAVDHQISDLEYRILETLPVVLATRERFWIFFKQLQGLLSTGFTLASVPCGLMSELLMLNYSQHQDVTLMGIDLDPEALEGAWAEAKKRGLSGRVSLYCEDAWALSLYEEVDILVSNGLNIYEPDDARVTLLYKLFFNALKPGGKLITSFLTPPPTLGVPSPWDFSAIDQEALLLQQRLFIHLLEVKWGAFRTHEQTRDQLQSVGFTDIIFIEDRARMFPTVMAQKPR